MEQEKWQDKLMSKVRAEPLVPIGAFVTAGVLVGGIVSFRRGNKAMSQKMMRARVIAQAGTIVALGYGAYVSSLTAKEFSDEGYQGNLAQEAEK